MREHSKNTVTCVLGAGLKSAALFVLVCAAIALTGLALGIVLAAGALLVLLLIFALIVNPGEVKTLVKVLGDKISELISRLEALVASMREIIGEVSAAARAASGSAQPQTREASEADSEAKPQEVAGPQIGEQPKK